MKVYGGTRRTAPFILSLETMWTWIINCKPQPGRLGGPQSRSWTFRKKKSYLCRELNSRSFSPWSRSYTDRAITAATLTATRRLGFPDNLLLQLFLFHLSTQFYSRLCYMSCLRHVCFCHVIISSLFYVAYPYTKESQCLLGTSCFNMEAKPTLNCPLAFKRRDIWLQHTRGRTALWIPTSGSAVTLQ